MEILGRRFEGVENGEGGAEGGREWKRRALRGGGGHRGETTEEVASRGGGGVGGRWVAAVGGILVCVGDVPVLDELPLGRRRVRVTRGSQFFRGRATRDLANFGVGTQNISLAADSQKNL